MELIRRLERKRVGNRLLDINGLFLCPCCGNIVEKRIYDGIKIRTCGHSCKLRTHGDASMKRPRPRLYVSWAKMKYRCYSTKPHEEQYKYYRGKGIKVCKEWHEYENFKKWSLANGYEPHLTIDRKDSNGDYTPDNCQWITRAENCSKASLLNRMISTETIKRLRERFDVGDIKMVQLSEDFNLSYQSVYGIIKRITYVD